MSPLASKLLRQALFARDQTVSVPAVSAFSPDARAARELDSGKLVRETARRSDASGNVLIVYILTSAGREAARKLVALRG